MNINIPESNLAEKICQFRMAEKKTIYTLDVIDFLLDPRVKPQLKLKEIQQLIRYREKIEEEILRHTRMLKEIIPPDIVLDKLKNGIGFYGLSWEVTDVLNRLSEDILQRWIDIEKKHQRVKPNL